MIDLKFLRENPDVVKENIKKKFQDSKLLLVDEVIALDAEYRAAQKPGLRSPRQMSCVPAVINFPSRLVP